MATITGLTAARMLAIEAASVVSGHIDTTGELILVQHDGTEISAGSMPGKGVQYVTGIAEGDLPTAYPDGVSLMVLDSGSGWTLNDGVGSIVTYKFTADRYQQNFFANGGGTSAVLEWSRAYDTTVGGGGWTPWQPVSIVNVIPDPDAFDQTDEITYYPPGESRAYFSTSASSGWDFSNSAGELLTYRDDANGVAKQTWTRSPGGLGGNKAEVWTRTWTTSFQWTAWNKLNDTIWVNMTLASGFTALADGSGIQYRVKNDVFCISGGATGTYVNGTYEKVIPIGGIPAVYRPVHPVRGGSMGTGLRSGGFEILPDGSVNLGHALTSAPGWLGFSASYPIGS